ncbi:hypothetical protein O9993_20985 [Vibrio lentus]|nr:hypothetical protein [Vibrio lentus]
MYGSSRYGEKLPGILTLDSLKPDVFANIPARTKYCSHCSINYAMVLTFRN